MIFKDVFIIVECYIVILGFFLSGCEDLLCYLNVGILFI